MPTTIPFNKPYFSGHETRYIEQAVRSGKISGDGLFTKRVHAFFEQTLGFRDATEASWYAALWKRSNMVPGSPLIPRELEPEEAKGLHGELMVLNKELAQLGFTALTFYAMAASPYRRATQLVGPALGLLVGLAGLIACGAGGEDGEDLAGDVALEASDDLGLGQPFGGASGGVGPGAGVVTQPAKYDDVEGVVRPAVAATVESVAVGPPAAGRDRSNPAQMRERGLRAQPVGVVTGSDEYLSGDFGADPGQGDQPRGSRGH